MRVEHEGCFLGLCYDMGIVNQEVRNLVGIDTYSTNLRRWILTRLCTRVILVVVHVGLETDRRRACSLAPPHF